MKLDLLQWPGVSTGADQIRIFICAVLMCIWGTMVACSPTDQDQQPTDIGTKPGSPTGTSAIERSSTPIWIDSTETPEPTPTVIVSTQLATSTVIPEDRSVSYRSPYGNWTVYEIPLELIAQVVNDEGTVRWSIDWKSVEPIYGNEFNYMHFFEDGIYFGVGPVIYEIQILQREAPIYSLYRLDLADGSITLILEPVYGDDGFAEYAYFQLSSDQERSRDPHGN